MCFKSTSFIFTMLKILYVIFGLKTMHFEVRRACVTLSFRKKIMLYNSWSDTMKMQRNSLDSYRFRFSPYHFTTLGQESGSAETIIYVSAISRGLIMYLQKGSYKSYQPDWKSLFVALVGLVGYIFCAADKPCKIHCLLVYIGKLLSSWCVFLLEAGMTQ